MVDVYILIKCWQLGYLWPVRSQHFPRFKLPSHRAMAWCPPASTGQRPGVHHLLRALIDEAHAAAAIVGLRQNPHDLADFAAEWLGFDDFCWGRSNLSWMKSKMLECQKTQNGSLKWKNGDQPLDWGVPFLQTNPSTFYLRMTIHHRHT